MQRGPLVDRKRFHEPAGLQPARAVGRIEDADTNKSVSISGGCTVAASDLHSMIMPPNSYLVLPEANQSRVL